MASTLLTFMLSFDANLYTNILFLHMNSSTQATVT